MASITLEMDVAISFAFYRIYQVLDNDAHGTASMWNQAGQSNICQRSVHSYIFDPASALFMMSCK